MVNIYPTPLHEQDVTQGQFLINQCNGNEEV